MKLMSDKQKSLGFMKNRLLALGVSIVFSIVLFHIFALLLGLNYSVLSILPLIILFNILWMLLGYNKRIILLLLALLIIIFGIYYLLIKPDEKIRIAHWFESIILKAQDHLNWALTINEFKGPEPQGFQTILIGMITFISNFVVWGLNSVLLALVLFVLPQFFVVNITYTPHYFIFLVLGFVVMLMMMTQSKKIKFKRPPIIAILVVIVSALLISSSTNSQMFYNEEINKKYFRIYNSDDNDFLENDLPFNLKTVGFSNGSSKIGGPVSLTHTPFMEVTGPKNSFYLKGNVYLQFIGMRWRNVKVNKDNGIELIDGEFEIGFDSDTFNLALLNNETISIKPFSEIETIFYPGFLLSVDMVSQSPIYYDYNGQFVSDKTELFKGYSVKSVVYDHTKLSDLIKTDTFAIKVHKDDLSPKFSYGKYEKLIKELDPLLHSIAYDTKEKDSIKIALDITNYFANGDFKYTLNVKEVEAKNEKDFIEDFLLDREGYCVYYATVLQLILEDLGYVSNYVEGFVVPSSSNEKRIVTSDYAHAWVEILVNGLGPVVLDPTPSVHTDRLNGIVNQPDNQETPEPLPQDEPRETPTPTPEVTPTPDNNVESEKKDIGTLWIWVSSFLLLGMYVVYKYEKQKKRHLESFLKEKYKNTQDLIKNVYFNMIDLYKIDGHTINSSKSVSENYKIISRNYHFAQSDYCVDLLEKAFYSKDQSEDMMTAPLLINYESMEEEIKKKNPIKWFIKRILL